THALRWGVSNSSSTSAAPSNNPMPTPASAPHQNVDDRSGQRFQLGLTDWTSAICTPCPGRSRGQVTLAYGLWDAEPNVGYDQSRSILHVGVCLFHNFLRYRESDRESPRITS